MEAHRDEWHDVFAGMWCQLHVPLLLRTFRTLACAAALVGHPSSCLWLRMMLVGMQFGLIPKPACPQ